MEANTGAPQVAYREALCGPADSNMKFVRQSGGRGQYGHCIINLIPGESGSGIVFENKVVGGNIPKEFIKPIEQGIREAAASGVLAGYPVIDFKVELIDGSYHPVASSEMAFKIAGSMAFKDAAKKAGLMLLEPIMKVELNAPDDHRCREQRHQPRSGEHSSGGAVRVCDGDSFALPRACHLFDGTGAFRTCSETNPRQNCGEEISYGYGKKPAYPDSASGV